MVKSRSNLDQFLQNLQDKIKAAYESSITIPEAEKLAGEFLHAQFVISKELAIADLDARMRKQGVKAIKAALYMEGATKVDKKPSDVLLNAQVDMSELTQSEQTSYDEAEVYAESLKTHLRICSESHVYFRQLSRATG